MKIKYSFYIFLSFAIVRYLIPNFFLKKPILLYELVVLSMSYTIFHLINTTYIQEKK